MFDIGASEFLLIVIVAIVAIGPKDLPRALRTAGNWIGKVRRVSGHFRSGVETMIREAELADMEKKWREQNEAIMAANPPATADEALIGLDPGTGPSDPPADPKPQA
jgi:sec-independent protein translocase protein TatB